MTFLVRKRIMDVLVRDTLLDIYVTILRPDPRAAKV